MVLESCGGRDLETVFASDLNPVPVLLNKVVLEYIPKHGQHSGMKSGSGATINEAEQNGRNSTPRTPMVLHRSPTYGRGRFSQRRLAKVTYQLRFRCFVQCGWPRKEADTEHSAGNATRTAELKQKLRKVRYANGDERAVRRAILEVFEPKTSAEVEVAPSKGRSRHMSSYRLYDLC